MTASRPTSGDNPSILSRSRTMARGFPMHVPLRVRTAAALIPLAIWGGLSGICARAATSAGDAHAELVYVGTQQHEMRALRFDAASGKLAMIGPVGAGPRATWVMANPRLPVLYAVDDDNAHEGSVIAYAVDRDSGALTPINAVATGGRGTTNLSLDQPSMTLLAANYGSGSVASVAVNEDGSLGARTSLVEEAGSGPNRRQASAHAHNAVVDPSGRHALVPDLGADRVFVHAFDRATRTLKPGGQFAVPPGAGPRHLVFGPDGKYVYLLTELSAELMVLRWDASRGQLAPVQTVETTSPAFQGVKSGAEVAIGADGRFLYVENRAENALLVYRIDGISGELTQVQRISSGGEKPWGLGIDRSGKWLLVANQRSGTVNVFEVDTVTGRLSDTGQAVGVPDPVAIAFVGNP
ncbi:lactonase family protein [Burkholderia pseudomultivorans]|uniref:lactonase family protein n=1 Tax=Burkholderia pseudomultivorans TaxID=1207504 RepID=UPI002875F0BE|nr:lactonase family protein [Burkholderia pseudomultivorans]MDS0861345.1 lactonase family protein [Burkholderia pseudomultivorans]